MGGKPQSKGSKSAPGSRELPEGFVPYVPPPDFFVFRGTDQDARPADVPVRLTRQRVWPTIQRSRADLEEAIAWFEYIAEISDIRVMRLAPGMGQAGQYSLPERGIYLADELFEHPALYGWVLAHGLGHAVDPRFEAFGAIEYGQPGHKYKTPDYELIAEAAAIEAFRSFRLILFPRSDHLVSIVGEKGKQRLLNPKMGGRIRVAAGILRKPLPRDTREQPRKYRRVQHDLQSASDAPTSESKTRWQATDSWRTCSPAKRYSTCGDELPAVRQGQGTAAPSYGQWKRIVRDDIFPRS